MQRQRDDARTGSRLTCMGCLAGLVVALAVPLWGIAFYFVAALFG
ncbi:hypothetical protein [Streptomyces gossypii]|nr:hypothetical protein [Streptomyces gossypii]